MQSGHSGTIVNCSLMTHSVTSPPQIAALRKVYSITSSALACSVCGMPKPSDLAVFKLMTKSNLVGCSTGRSTGLVPLRTNRRARHGYGYPCERRYYDYYDGPAVTFGAGPGWHDDWHGHYWHR